jgi:hypothetical protein
MFFFKHFNYLKAKLKTILNNTGCYVPKGIKKLLSFEKSRKSQQSYGKHTIRESRIWPKFLFDKRTAIKR